MDAKAAPFRANWADNPSVEDMERELIERCDEMTGTEISVKTRRLRQAGGYWPNSLSEWSTPEGRELRKRIALETSAHDSLRDKLAAARRV